MLRLTLAEKITETQTRLTAYIAAELHILQGGQSYTIGNRSLDRGDLDTIRKAIIQLRTDLDTLNRGNRFRMQRIVPRDI